MGNPRTPERYSPAAVAYCQASSHANCASHPDQVCHVMDAFDAGVASVAQPTPRTLTTAAELDALDPLETDRYILCSIGHLYCKQLDGKFVRAFAGVELTAQALVKHGPLALLAPVTAAPEPVRLTDPEDPRIRNGAVVTVLFKEDDDNAITYRVRIGGSNPRGTVAWVRNCVRGEGVYLLAAAPDPDAARVALVVEWLAPEDLAPILTHEEAARDLLARLDALSADA